MTPPSIRPFGATIALPSLLLLAAFLACSSPPQDAPPSAVTTGIAHAGDGLKIAYDVRGHGESTLVFVHCWACDRSFWREQLDVFADRYRVVSLDLGGHGESGRQRNAWTLEGLAGDVVAVADALELGRMVLVGHSMGGPVSLLAVPLLRDRVVGVVCADTLHNAEQQADAAMMEPALAAIRDDYEGFMSQAVEGMFPDPQDPTLRDWIVSHALAADHAAVIALMADFPSFDAKTALAAAGVPIRCINAAPRPPVGPATEVEANRRYADFDAILMENVGHFLQLERPVEFNGHLSQLLDELLAR